MVSRSITVTGAGAVKGVWGRREAVSTKGTSEKYSSSAAPAGAMLLPSSRSNTPALRGRLSWSVR